MFKKIILALISLYQKTLSHYFGGMCRFHPTCSEYAKLSIINYGVFKGVFKSIWRIVRCNPLNKGGIDFP